MASILFTIEGKKVIPFPTTLLIPCFATIWERDDSPGKEYALEDFAYIEFMTSLLKSNPYKGYNKDVRKRVLQQDVITRKNWKEDEYIKECIAKIETFQLDASPSYSLWKASYRAKEKLETFFNTFDMNERNEKTGLPIYKPKEITSALLDVDKATASLSALEKKVEEDVFEAVKTRGMKEISPFADPASLKRRR